MSKTKYQYIALISYIAGIICNALAWIIWWVFAVPALLFYGVALYCAICKPVIGSKS